MLLVWSFPASGLHQSQLYTVNLRPSGSHGETRWNEPRRTPYECANAACACNLRSINVCVACDRFLYMHMCVATDTMTPPNMAISPLLSRSRSIVSSRFTSRAMFDGGPIVPLTRNLIMNTKRDDAGGDNAMYKKKMQMPLGQRYHNSFRTVGHFIHSARAGVTRREVKDAHTEACALCKLCFSPEDTQLYLVKVLAFCSFEEGAGIRPK